MPPRTSSTITHVLLLVALVEVAVNRIAVPMLRPVGPAPWWHTALDYLGLFAFHFVAALAVLVMLARAGFALREPARVRERLGQITLGLTAVVALVPIVMDPTRGVSLALAACFAIAILAQLIAAVGLGRDLGAQLGLAIIVMVLCACTLTLWIAQLSEHGDVYLAPDAPGHLYVVIAGGGLAAAALLSPYCFAPRPFVRAVMQPLPVIVAVAVAAVGAAASRSSYDSLAATIEKVFGLQITKTGTPEPAFAVYLLAIATLAWTVTACGRAKAPARRAVALGLGLIVLGGFAFRDTHHFLLPLLGVALIAEATHTVRDEELAAMPLVAHGPAIGDAAWSGYIAMLTQGLRRSIGEVHSLTTHDHAGVSSSIVVGDRAGLPIRLRIDRLHGRVLALDLVIGREVAPSREPSLTLWAIPRRGRPRFPYGEITGSRIDAGDAKFDAGFRCYGDPHAFRMLFDPPSQASALAVLDGWLCYWQPEGLRYRLYPGFVAPLDQTIPISDLAHGGLAPSAERLLAVVELLVGMASRVITPVPPAEAAELDA